DLERAIKAISADLDKHGESPAQYARLRAKEGRKKEVVEALAEARERDANPLRASWGAAKSLAGALATAPDPQHARLRLRSALGNIVAEVWLLVVRRGRDRVAAAQLWFHGGGKHRDYLILHLNGRGNGLMHAPPKWGCWSRVFQTKAGKLDL